MARIDGINPLQPDAGMELYRMKERYGNKIVLSGNVDSGILQFGTPEMVKRATEECIKAAAPGGGYFFGTGAGETFRTVHKHGKYPSR